MDSFAHPHDTTKSPNGIPPDVDFDAILDGSQRSAGEIEAEQLEQAAEDALLSQGAHDEGNAQCVNLRYHGRFVQNEAWGWLAYTGTHWEREAAEATVDRAIVETLSARIEAALQSGAADLHAEVIRKAIPTSARVQGAKYLLRSIVTKSAREFDADPDLLNCPNGVVDLRTGELITHSPSQAFTYVTAADYVPEASAETFTRFLVGAVGEEQADYLQLAIGYTLTGHTREETLFYLYGPPRSGKGTLTETLRTVLGSPLAEAVSFDILTAPRDVDSQNFRLAPLHGSRMIAASESNQYERFNEAKLKALTGGDHIQAAFKHHTPFSFRPTFKIWLSSNQPPNADPDDDAVWSRLRVIHFPTSHLGGEDKTLKERMRSPAVLEGVLAWAVEGARRWYALGRSGLPEPAGMAALKDQQRGALDNVGAWLDECCGLGDHYFTPSSELYRSYAEWCKDNGVKPKQQRGMTESLQHKGYRADRQYVDGKRCRGFFGLTVS